MQAHAVETKSRIDPETLDAEALLEWAGEQFGERAALASSFSPEDVIVIDLLVKQQSPIRVFALDTGRLHEETYQVIEAVREKYNKEIEIYFPDQRKVEKMTREKGYFSFYESLENRKECCRIRKVEPLKRALSGLDAWITGLRREQSPTRTDLKRVEFDVSNNFMYKLNPLIDWTEVEVWEYIKAHNVPYNKLFDQGFQSIGCAPCTRAIRRTDHQRAGRWWWENPDSKECGLH